MKLHRTPATVLGMVCAALLGALAPGCLQNGPKGDAPDGEHAAPGLSVSAGEVSFPAADGVRVHGDLALASGAATTPLILLFHQGGADGRGEYAPIAPRLREHGYHTLIVDQRVGGDLFGGTNRTAEGFEGAARAHYCDAYPDLVGALDFALASGFDGPIIAWGSSYSAALVARLGSEQPGDLDAVLGFSPASGEAMGACPAERFLEGLRVPALFLRPSSELEREDSRRRFEAIGAAGHRIHEAPGGVHGSSMLVDDRAPGPTDPTWGVVLSFLASIRDRWPAAR